MLLKCCTQYVSNFGKLSSSHRTRKGQFSFHWMKEECPNYHLIVLISHSSKDMCKILQARLQQYVNRELPDNTRWFSKRQRNQRSNCQHLFDHGESKRIPENHLLLLHWLCWSLLWIVTNWKILNRDENARSPSLSPEKPVCGSRSNS